jgi:hypothetical protein
MKSKRLLLHCSVPTPLWGKADWVTVVVATPEWIYMRSDKQFMCRFSRIGHPRSEATSL